MQKSDNILTFAWRFFLIKKFLNYDVLNFWDDNLFRFQD